MTELITAPLRLILSGVHIVPGSIGCCYPPQVDAGDLLEVDFDQRSLSSDGLYLVELIETSGGEKWRGCRRFQRKPGEWWIDQSGDKEWSKISSVDAIGLRVVGYVREVYKPSRRINEIIGRAISANLKTC